ncbi:MAG: MFS transporter [Clostridia bacterium]|nr:MFS transporter [Clostridia bacterium]MBQ9704160.1 MFS transporter [Clostridia bacterium]
MKLNYKRTILVGFAFFLISAFWQAYDTVVPLIMTNKFGMKQLSSGIIMSLDNIFAVFMLPIFGAISDKVRCKYGRRTPFIFFGTVFAAILFVVLGFINTIGVFVIVLLFTLMAMATFRSPAVALMPDVTVKPLRSKGNAIINLMGTAGGIIVLGLGMVLKTDTPGKTDFGVYIVTVSGLMIVALVVFLLTVKEPKWAKEMELDTVKYCIEEEEESPDGIKRNLNRAELKSLILILASVVLWYVGYNAVTSKYSVYATTVLQVPYTLTLMIAQAAAVVAYIPVGMIASKFGRRKTILAGIIMLTVAFGSAAFIKAGTPAIVMYLLFCLAGIGWATINVNSFPMVVELAKVGDVGKYTGFYYTASMSAQIVTPILSGALLDACGWWIFFPYAAVFAGLAFVTMFFVKHGDAKPEKVGALEALGGADD